MHHGGGSFCHQLVAGVCLCTVVVAAQRRVVAAVAEERSAGAEDFLAEESEEREGPGDGHGLLVGEEDGNSVTPAGPGPGSRNLRLQLKLWL